MKYKKLLLLITLAFFTITNSYSLDEMFPDLNQSFSMNIDKYCINSDDTLAKIAMQHKVSVSFLLYLNKKIDNPDKIYAGQVIQIPGQKIIKLIESHSRRYMPLIEKLGHDEYKFRKAAIDELSRQDWRAVPALLTALQHRDVEIRENAKEALREIHRVTRRPQNLKL